MIKYFFLIILLFNNLVISADEKNSIIVCENGLEMFAWDLEFVSHAEHSIDIAACFFGGIIARKLLSAIEARMDVCPNLQVKILATPIFLENEDFALIEHLKAKFPNRFRLVHATNVAIIWPDVTSIDNHTKMFIVDERYFSIGGTNLEETQCSEGTYTPPRTGNKLTEIAKSLPAGNRDQDIVGRGAIAKEMRQTFCKLFALWERYNHTHSFESDPEQFKDNSHYFEVPTQPFVERFESSDHLITLNVDQLKFILGGPHQVTNAITSEYVRLIKGAKKEIKIGNLYLCPADEIFYALLDAVNRGVKLIVISNGTSEIAPQCTQYFCWANRMSYVPLLYGGTYPVWSYWSLKGREPKNTDIYEYHVGDVLLHKKIMVVDDQVLVIGSYNLGLKSHAADYESVMVIDNPDVVRDMNKVFSRDLLFSRKVSSDQAIEWYFDPLIAYLGKVQKRIHGLL